MDDDEDDDGCSGVDGDDEDGSQASKIWAAAWWIPFSEFPLQVPSGGEVSWFLCVSIVLISYPSSLG
jgi:hypothetical protein